jgi:uncharacterized protein (DUF1330 family)
MTAYAMAHLRTVDVNDEVLEYLTRIDDTLEPYGGRFLVHGTMPEVLDGDIPGFVVLVAFPDYDSAKAWYHSPGYQAILPFRVNNSEGGAGLLRTVPDGYRAADYAEKVRAARG